MEHDRMHPRALRELDHVTVKLLSVWFYLWTVIVIWTGPQWLEKCKRHTCLLTKQEGALQELLAREDNHYPRSESIFLEATYRNMRLDLERPPQHEHFQVIYNTDSSNSQFFSTLHATMWNSGKSINDDSEKVDAIVLNNKQKQKYIFKIFFSQNVKKFFSCSISTCKFYLKLQYFVILNCCGLPSSPFPGILGCSPLGFCLCLRDIFCSSLCLRGRGRVNLVIW